MNLRAAALGAVFWCLGVTAWADGVLVTGVTPGSQAEQAGLQPGDVILSYDGVKLAGIEELVAAVQEAVEKYQRDPEAKLVAVIERNGERTDVTFRAGPLGVKLAPNTGYERGKLARAQAKREALAAWDQLADSWPGAGEQKRQALISRACAWIEEHGFLLGEEWVYDQLVQPYLVKASEGFGQTALEDSGLSLAVASLGRLKGQKQPSEAASDQCATWSLWLERVLEYRQAELAVWAKANGKYEDGMAVLTRETLAQARSAFEEAAQLYEELGELWGHAGTLNNLGVVALNQDRYEEAMTCFERSLTVRESIGDRAEAAMTLENMAFAAEAQLRYDQALSCCERALSIYEEMSDLPAMASTLDDMAHFACSLSRYEKASACYKRSFELAGELDDRGRAARALHGLGTVALQQARYEEAFSCYERSLALSEEIEDRARMASTLNGMGEVARRQRRVEEARAYYERSLATAGEIGDRAVEGMALHNLGLVAKAQFRYEEAAALYERSLAISHELGDPFGMAVCLHSLGGLASDRTRYKEALAFYERSLAIEKQLGDRAGMAGTLHNMGKVASELYRFDRAHSYYEQSLAICEQVGARAGVAAALHNLGYVAQCRSRYAEALSYYEQSLELYEEIGDPEGIAANLLQLGLIASELSHHDEANSCYERSRALYEELGDRSAQSNVVNAMGIAAVLQSRYEDALAYYEQSLSIVEEVGHQRRVASVLGNMGSVACKQARFQEALSYYRRSLELCEETDDRRGVAVALGNIGSVAAYQLQFEEARAYYQQSLSIRKELGDRAGVASMLANLGGVAKELARYEEAADYFERSLAIREEIGDRAGTAMTLNNMGEMFGEQKQHEKALDHFERSLQRTQELADRAEEAAVLENIGRTQLERDAAKEAVPVLERALRLHSELRGQYSDPESRLEAGVAWGTDPLDPLVAALMALERPSQALMALERGRAAASRILIAEARADLRSQVSADLLLKERRLVAELHAIPSRVVRAESQQEREALRAQAFDLERELRLAARAMRQANPALTVTDAEELPDLKTLAQSLPEATLYLTWHTGELCRTAFLLNRDGTLHVRTVPEKAVELARFLSVATRKLQVPPEIIRKLASRTREALLGDLAQLAAQAERVVVSPPADLAGVPWSLVLGEELEVCLAPSLLAWSIPKKSRATQRFEVVVLGDPRDPEQEHGTERFRKSPEALPFARAEAERIAALVSQAGHAVQLATGQEATEAWLEEYLQQESEKLSHLHLAVHGVTDTVRPWQAYLHLGGDQNADGRWTFQELFRVRLPNLRVVVLSACETAVGETVQGEGMLGLVRAFQFIGAKDVVGTLWAVADEATAALMETFYEELLGDASAPEALHSAQARLRATEKWSHPYYWAGFVVYSRR